MADKWYHKMYSIKIIQRRQEKWEKETKDRWKNRKQITR